MSRGASLRRLCRLESSEAVRCLSCYLLRGESSSHSWTGSFESHADHHRPTKLSPLSNQCKNHSNHWGPSGESEDSLTDCLRAKPAARTHELVRAGYRRGAEYDKVATTENVPLPAPSALIRYVPHAGTENDTLA